MRILYVSHSFPKAAEPLSNVGGMQRVAGDLYRALAKHPDVRVTPLLLETSWTWTRVRTGPFLLSLVRRLPEIVRAERIQVVLFSSMVTASVVTVLQDRLRGGGALTAAIAVGRDVTLSNPIYQSFVPRVLKKLDLVLPISRATAEVALQRGASAARVHVVPCGVDLQRRVPVEPKADRREALVAYLAARGFRPPHDALLLLSVGRHQERKGFHWFVDAVMPAVPPGIVYLLAGTGPLTQHIAESIAKRNLQNRVLLLGQVTEDVLHTLYAGSDVFLMPNIPVQGDIEGFGVVTLEAGSAGLPVIASKLEGIRDAVYPGQNGCLLEPGDVRGFVGEIERLADPAILAAESARAARYVHETFGWDGIVERYLEILRARVV